MKTRRRSWWLVFGGGAAAVILALTWITTVVIDLEREGLAARAEADYQGRLRLAMWRMEDWLGRRIDHESDRPWVEYQSYYAQQPAYTSILNEIRPGNVYIPSPLLTHDSEFFPLHFQLTADDVLTSPQVPQGNFRDLAESEYGIAEAIAVKSEMLDEIRRLMELSTVSFQDSCVAAISNEIVSAASLEDTFISILPGAPANDVESQTLQSKKEWAKRAQSRNIAQQVEAPRIYQGNQQIDIDTSQLTKATIDTGRMVPVWLGTIGPDGDNRLTLVRQVTIDDSPIYQGIVANWPRLREALLEEIRDLFPQAELGPIPIDETTATATENRLVRIPAELAAQRPPVVPASMTSPARVALMITWLAIGLAIIAGAVSLRSSIAFGEKRSRFASLVTHELRTPLTTFRMYSEMLADGMVSDDGQRQTYLETLKDESGRLSNLVENVLAYARLEEGRAPRQPRAMTLADLIAHVEPQLRQRVDACDMSFDIDIEAPDDTPLHIDADAVSQILFNLVDNACKYAGGDGDGKIHLSARLTDDRIAFRVRDNGAGVPVAYARSIFVPFERGDRDETDPVPGLGLGLALSRGLARDLGGELSLESTGSDGSCFKLVIPLPA